MIEKEYKRNVFPSVYQSLLLIFNAQMKSLFQQGIQKLPYEVDILGHSIEKGGTSVLADGFLVNGNLSDKEADFCFGFGSLLQFADDIQDIKIDLKNHHRTIFSQAAEEFLDKLANKLLNYIARVVSLKLDSEIPREKELEELIINNCFFLIMEALEKNSCFYSKKYLERIQHHFPVRFSSLSKIRKKVQKNILTKGKKIVTLDLILSFLLTVTSNTMLD
jgi:hypothetical protein